MFLNRWVVIVGLLMLVIVSINVDAATDITCGDTAGLITAITTANSNSSPDVINLASSCTYTMTQTLTISDDGTDNSVTINGNGSTLDGDGSYRIFEITSGGELVIENMTLTGGKAAGRGGAIYSYAGKLTADSVLFTLNDNGNWSGGALATSNGSVVEITDSQFTYNAGYSAGAIFHDAGGSMTLTNVDMSNNSANGSLGDGGAIISAATLFIIGGTYENNAANLDGGFMVAYSPTPTITGATIQNNSSERHGGAIYLPSSGGITVVNSLIDSNSTGDHATISRGGAIYGINHNDITIGKTTR